MWKDDLLEIKSKLNVQIEDSLLIKILFDVSKYFDKNFVKYLKIFQKENKKIFNSNVRKTLRNYYYYGNDLLLSQLLIKKFGTIKYTEFDLETCIQDFKKRLKKYDSSKILNSIKKRFCNLLNSCTSFESHQKDWLNYYNNKRKKLFDFSAFF